jgi:3-phenylpropionate/cinnamic acid dioxygenase small subunit
MTASAELREEVSELYFDYVEAIENGAIDLWPTFFDEQCVYKLISKENHESGLPLALIFCDSQGMLKDRVFASMKLNVYAPRVWRYSLGRVRAEQQDGGQIAGSATFAIFETLTGQSTRILCTGRYLDKLVRVGGRLKFRERLCVYDTTLVPGSIVFPV